MLKLLLIRRGTVWEGVGSESHISKDNGPQWRMRWSLIDLRTLHSLQSEVRIFALKFAMEWCLGRVPIAHRCIIVIGIAEKVCCLCTQDKSFAIFSGAGFQSWTQRLPHAPVMIISHQNISDHFRTRVEGSSLDVRNLYHPSSGARGDLRGLVVALHSTRATLANSNVFEAAGHILTHVLDRLHHASAHGYLSHRFCQ